jgi:hypothetical protein
LFERDEYSNGDVLMVMAVLPLNMIEDAIRDGHPPLEALDKCLHDIRNCVTDQFAQPRMPAELRH